MKNVFLFFLVTLSGQVYAQSLSIEECYAAAMKNYPLIKQRELIAQTNEYTLQNITTGYLPQLSLNGQATYQSEVTQVPIKMPGADIPTLSKDQYKVYAEINQSLYDGGVIHQQKLSQENSSKAEGQKLEVELYKLRERINQLYFGVLLVDEQIKQTDLLKGDIQLGIKKTEGAIANGAAFKSSLNVLKAELLKANQRTTELISMRTAYVDALGLFMNQSLDSKVVLSRPDPITTNNEITRPELQLYDYQRRMLSTQESLLSARNRPRLSLFVQGGYGRPALNMLSNDFESYYLGGIRLNWSLGGLYTLKRDRALIDLSRKNLDTQQETFLFNTNYTLKQQNAEVNKYNALLTADDEIVTLRESVKTTAAVQLENGVINTNDYLREVNAEDQARQSKITHEIQRLMAMYAVQNTTGNIN